MVFVERIIRKSSAMNFKILAEIWSLSWTSVGFQYLNGNDFLCLKVFFQGIDVQWHEKLLADYWNSRNILRLNRWQFILRTHAKTQSRWQKCLPGKKIHLHTSNLITALLPTWQSSLLIKVKGSNPQQPKPGQFSPSLWSPSWYSYLPKEALSESLTFYIS